MPREVVLWGLVIPTLVPLFVVCFAVLWQLDKRVFLRWNVYRKVAHPALFRLAVFVILFCCAGLFVY